METSLFIVVVDVATATASARSLLRPLTDFPHKQQGEAPVVRLPPFVLRAARTHHKKRRFPALTFTCFSRVVLLLGNVSYYYVLPSIALRCTVLLWCYYSINIIQQCCCYCPLSYCTGFQELQVQIRQGTARR